MNNNLIVSGELLVSAQVKVIKHGPFSVTLEHDGQQFELNRGSTFTLHMPITIHPLIST